MYISKTGTLCENRKAENAVSNAYPLSLDIPKHQQISMDELQLAIVTFDLVICKMLKCKLVEPRGFEPLTPTMPLWCSTN